MWRHQPCLETQHTDLLDKCSIVETSIAIMCSSIPAFAALLKHTVSHTRFHHQLRSRPTTDEFTKSPSPSEKESRPSNAPSCYAVSHAQGRDAVFLGRFPIRNQDGDTEICDPYLMTDAIENGGIAQSIAIDVSVSQKPIRTGDGDMMSYEQVLPASYFPKAVYRDQHMGFVAKGHRKEKV